MSDNDPIQVLMDEHEVINAAQATIQRLGGLWESDEKAFEAKVRKLLEFFRVYSDEFHHRKEEDVLFPALRDEPEFVQDDVLFELEAHHDMFRRFTGDIERALGDKEWVEAYSILSDYINMLMGHIAVENEMLFVLAADVLSEDQLEKIYFLFQDIDTELGKGKKQELAGFVTGSGEKAA